MRLPLIATALLLGLLTACESENHPTERPNVFSEHQFITAAKATKELGQDCTTSGETECKSKICVHVSGKMDRDFICSKACSADDDCIESSTTAATATTGPQFRCVQVYPAPNSSFCLPAQANSGVLP